MAVLRTVGSFATGIVGSGPDKRPAPGDVLPVLGTHEQLRALLVPFGRQEGWE